MSRQNPNETEVSLSPEERLEYELWSKSLGGPCGTEVCDWCGQTTAHWAEIGVFNACRECYTKHCPGAAGTRVCTGCGSRIPMDANVCAVCANCRDQVPTRHLVYGPECECEFSPLLLTVEEGETALRAAGLSAEPFEWTDADYVLAEKTLAAAREAKTAKLLPVPAGCRIAG